MICDFQSTWKNGLKVHMSRNHADIEQLDSIAADDKYLETEMYWKTGKLTTIFQSFLDCNEILETIDNFTEEEKILEKEKVLNGGAPVLSNQNIKSFPYTLLKPT